MAKGKNLDKGSDKKEATKSLKEKRAEKIKKPHSWAHFLGHLKAGKNRNFSR